MNFSVALFYISGLSRYIKTLKYSANYTYLKEMMGLVSFTGLVLVIVGIIAYMITGSDEYALILLGSGLAIIWIGLSESKRGRKRKAK